MPSLFEQLNTALEGSDVFTQLPQQVSKLTTVATTVGDLIQNPPDSLTDFSRTLNELPLPNLSGNEFGSALSSLQNALPQEVTSITGDLIGKIDEFRETVSGDLVNILFEVLAAAQALHRLITADFTCSPETGESNGAVDNGSLNGGGSPGDSGSNGSGDSDAEPGELSRAADQVQTIQNILDDFPSPFNVENFLEWLNSLVEFRRESSVLAANLPVIDDIIDPLNTLTNWNTFTADQLRDHVAQSLQDLVQFIRSTVLNFISAIATDISATAGQLETTALTQITGDLTVRLGELKSAVENADLSSTTDAVDEINTRLDSFETIRTAMQDNLFPAIKQLNDRLSTLPDDAIDEMGRLISVLRPNPAIGEFANAIPAPNSAAIVQEELEQQFQPLVDWIEALTEKLDFQAIQDPLTTAANTARGVVDGLEQGLVDITIQVRAIFGELESLLDQVNTEELVNEIKAAIQDFQTELVQQIESLFSPVRDTISGIISTIDGQITEFSPEDIIESLRQVITNITAVFEDPAVVSAIEDIRSALETVNNQVEELSFAPITDTVINGMEEISGALKGIDTSELNDILRSALKKALEILPDDLTPLTDPLVDEFDDLVESGPLPLLKKVQTQPRKLLDKVREFEPAKLVGDELSEPYQALLTQMDAFKPSGLLAPVNAELDKLKDRLNQTADPGKLIEPLETPFNQLVANFDKFKPEDLVEPINTAISATVNQLIDVLPVDEILNQIDAILKNIEDVIKFGEKITSVFEKINQLLSDLSDSENQLNSWKNSILDKAAAIADTAPVQAQFTALSSALDEINAAPLLALFQNAATPVLNSLAALEPETKHISLVQAYTNFPQSDLEALPNSPEKTAIIEALNRFNPLTPEFGAPYQTLRLYQTKLTEAQNGLQAIMATWDSQFHSQDGTLAAYRIANFDSTQLREWLELEMETSFLKPLNALFAHIEALAAPISVVFAQITNLVTTLQNKIADLLLGPNSLGGIRDALNDLVERLRNLNLDFLTESLEDIFNQARDKINAFNPANFKETLSESFKAALDEIDLDLIIPPEDLETLDNSFNTIIDKLKALDPEALVINVVQPEYEETIVPLVDTFDVSEILETIVEKLDTLEEDLKEELGRVNAAFQEMKAAVPV